MDAPKAKDGDPPAHPIAKRMTNAKARPFISKTLVASCRFDAIAALGETGPEWNYLPTERQFVRFLKSANGITTTLESCVLWRGTVGLRKRRTKRARLNGVTAFPCFYLNNTRLKVQRVVYAWFVGPLRISNSKILARCGEQRCLNPLHLRYGLKRVRIIRPATHRIILPDSGKVVNPTTPLTQQQYRTIISMGLQPAAFPLPLDPVVVENKRSRTWKTSSTTSCGDDSDAMSVASEIDDGAKDPHGHWKCIMGEKQEEIPFEDSDCEDPVLEKRGETKVVDVIALRTILGLSEIT